MRAPTCHSIAAMAVASAMSLSMAVLTACSGSAAAPQSSTPSSSSDRSHQSTSSQGTKSLRSTDGAGLFRAQCSACHGSTGEGNLGPPLVGIADRMSLAEQLDVVQSGRGRMPPFSPTLTNAEIAAVVQYTRTLR